MTAPKLAILQDLVEEQLRAGHVEPSTSPYNTPIFFIIKKSGKPRLLHDLREVNKHIKPMGSPQPGMPHPSAFPRDWYVAVLDIKDCFFSIPLHPDDRPRFAFTVPQPNHHRPAKRYQWKVLPQGMKNSPAICQLFVATAIEPLTSEATIVHYMDDILVAHPSEPKLQAIVASLLSNLKDIGLQINIEKAVFHPPFQFLGFEISETVTPMAPLINVPKTMTLHDLQQLCGQLNWLRPSLPVTTHQLQPLFQLLQTTGPPSQAPTKRVTLSYEAECALSCVNSALMDCLLQRIDPDKPFAGLVLPTRGTPTGLIWQDGPLLWVHLAKSKLRKITPQSVLFAQLAIALVERSTHHYGRHPDVIIWPLTTQQVTHLLKDSIDMQALFLLFSGPFDNHFPQHRLIQGLSTLPVAAPDHFPFPSSKPLPNAAIAFTDASKHCLAIVLYKPNSTQPLCHTRRHSSSVQVAELKAVTLALQYLQDQPVNIFTDSLYCLQVSRILAFAAFLPPASIGNRDINLALADLQLLLERRRQPWFIAHVRSHSGLPGPLAHGNHLADQAAQGASINALSPAAAVGDIINQAKTLHARFHLGAPALHRLLPELPIETCKHLVRACRSCAPLLPLGPLQPQGVNPRGLRPNSRWQLDVTHVASFGRWKFLHVAIDTFSHLCYAVALPGESAKYATQALREAILFMGVPWDIKTDNGPAYRSAAFAEFVKLYNITHHFGIAYNPQGQGLVERIHQTLKILVQKTRETQPRLTPRETVTQVLIQHNLMTFDSEGLSPVHKHWGPSYRPTPAPLVLWRDPLTSKWTGPAPLLTQGRGFACVFPESAPQPVWIPARLVKPFTPHGPADLPPPDPLPPDDSPLP